MLRAWLLRVVVGVALLTPRLQAQDQTPSSSDKAESLDRAPPVVPRYFLRRGGRRIESGLRVEGHPDGVRVSRRMFSPGGQPRGLALPEHLGGGFLFYQTMAVGGAPTTAFYRSETWTGELSPLGRVPFVVRYVAPGFDRIYLMGLTQRVALDVESGEVLPLDPLPPLVTLTGVAFDGARRALAQGPISGVLYTRDSGLTWSPVQDANSIEADLHGERLFVRTSQGIAVVSEEGEAVPFHKAGVPGSRLKSASFGQLLGGHVEQAVGGEPFPRGKWGDDSAHPDELERQWLAVLTRGARVGNRAYGLVGGELLSISLDEEMKLHRRSVTMAIPGRCVGTSVFPVTAQSSALFVCQGKSTKVVRLLPSWDLESVWSSSRSRRVLSSEGGGVLLQGSCLDDEDEEASACWVGEKAPMTVVLPGRFLKSRRHAFAVNHRAVWALWLSETSAKIKAQKLNGPSESKSWELSADHSVASFVKEGAILPHASVTPEGLSFWATRREKFVGVLLGDGERPSFGAVQRPLRRAVIDGPRAVLWGAAGFAKQTVDGGLSFVELSLPYRSGDPELSSVTSATSAVTMGCSSIGCALGRLLKIGWSTPEDTVEKLPELSTLQRPGRGRYRLSCGLDSASALNRINDSGPLPNFWDEKPPRVGQGFQGLTVAFPESLARIYAWGPNEGAWSRSGRAQAYFVDPWDPRSIRKTALTRQLFTSALDAQTKMGQLGVSRGFQYLSLDPSGQGGVMIFRGSTTTELFAFQENEPVERFEGAHQMGLRNLAGAVRTQGAYVAAFSGGSVLTLVRLAGGTIQIVGHVNLGESGRRGVQLVRTHAGDLGVALEGDDGLFIFPVSDQGELGAPLVQPFKPERPPVCPSEARGYIVDRELAVSPHLETSNGGALPVNRVRARWIVSGDKTCLEGLSGRGRGLGSLPPATPESALPLSVINSDAAGGRLQMLCQ